MSFSSDVKQELSKIGNFNKEILIAELIGYILSGNTIEKEEHYDFITENEFNIEHLYKVLFNLQLDYEPEIKGKCYIAIIKKNEYLKNCIKNFAKINGEIRKNIVKGAFLGSGSINNPDKNYHLEITFSNREYSDFVSQICSEYKVKFKELTSNERIQLYLKESEEISRFLALIGANKAVLKFENVRVLKEMKNNVNRKVNCETANLNKTVDAALKQINDINFIKKRKKFDQLPRELKEIANLRLENPDLSLQNLSELTDPPIRKICCKSKIKENS